jgi:hypothetical protein
MTPKGGTRKGAGRKPAFSVGKRVNIYLDAENVEWYESIPDGEKSKTINALILNRKHQEWVYGGKDERDTADEG